MLGRQESGQSQFFYALISTRWCRRIIWVRQMDSLLDLSWVHSDLASFYSHTGRPSIDPVLMILRAGLICDVWQQVPKME
jgi:hypothetical protein